MRSYPMVNPDFVATGEGSPLLEDVLARTEEPEAPKQYAVDMEKILQALETQRAMTERAMEQTAKSMEQVDQLIAIITNTLLK